MIVAILAESLPVALPAGYNWIVDLLREFGSMVAVMLYFMTKDWKATVKDKELTEKLSARLEDNTKVLRELKMVIEVLSDRIRSNG